MQQLKLKKLELGKAGTKEASPDKFNFYLVLAGHDKVNDAAKATTYRRKFKAPTLATESTKNGGPSEKDCHGKTVWKFQTK